MKEPTSSKKDYPHSLPRGYRFENYQILGVLGGGGFGLTYLARNIRIRQKVAIKEYFPSELAVRENTLRVQPVGRQDTRGFSWGLERFIEEARILTQFNHPNIVRVLYFFEANNTGYIVMEYEHGRSLADALHQGDTASQEEVDAILPQLLDALEKIHQANLLHRDLKPENIYIRDQDNSVVLLDFGSARYDVTRNSRPMTSIVSRGYAPFEQYTTASSQQGPWTDIYATGAVLYSAITGIIPPLESTKRLGATMRGEPDPLTPASKIVRKKFRRQLLQGIDWAMSILEKDRPQSIEAWREQLFAKKAGFWDKVIRK